MKARIFVISTIMVILVLLAIFGCSSAKTTTPITTTTSTTTTTTTTTTPLTTTTTTPTTTTATTTTTPSTTTTTMTTTTTGPLVPQMISLGHDYYATAPFAICLNCHDLDKAEPLASDHGGGLPPAVTSELCMVCHLLGTVTETPPPPTDYDVPSEEWTDMVTHPKEDFEDCRLCHGGTNKGSMKQISGQHACIQCHHADEERLATGLDGLCPELTGADVWKSCTRCHQPAE